MLHFLFEMLHFETTLQQKEMQHINKNINFAATNRRSSKFETTYLKY